MGSNYSRICGGAKSHEELYQFGDTPHIQPGCLRNNNKSPFSTMPRKMKSDYNEEESFSNMSKSLKDIELVTAHGWLYMLRYDRNTLD